MREAVDIGPRPTSAHMHMNFHSHAQVEERNVLDANGGK